MCVWASRKSQHYFSEPSPAKTEMRRQDVRTAESAGAGRVHEELCRKRSVTRSFLSQHHKELVDAQLFPVVCAFAPASNPSGSFALAPSSSCDSCSRDTIILDFPTHKTPTHCHTSDSRKVIHIVIASFKRENGDGATTMDPSSSPR